jgi:hypothetical protein
MPAARVVVADMQHLGVTAQLPQRPRQLILGAGAVETPLMVSRERRTADDVLQ